MAALIICSPEGGKFVFFALSYMLNLGEKTSSPPLFAYCRYSFLFVILFIFSPLYLKLLECFFGFYLFSL